MLSKYIDTRDFTSFHYLGLFVIGLLIFSIVFKDSVPKLDLAEMLKLKKFHEGYKNMTYPNSTASDFNQTIRNENENVFSELDFDTKSDGKKNVSHFKDITTSFETWGSVVAIKALMQGAIDPKETDITSPAFDKNMKVIEKINKVMEFTKNLETVKEELDV